MRVVTRWVELSFGFERTGLGFCGREMEEASGVGVSMEIGRMVRMVRADMSEHMLNACAMLRLCTESAWALMWWSVDSSSREEYALDCNTRALT